MDPLSTTNPDYSSAIQDLNNLQSNLFQQYLGIKTLQEGLDTQKLEMNIIDIGSRLNNCNSNQEVQKSEIEEIEENMNKVTSHLVTLSEQINSPKFTCLPPILEQINSKVQASVTALAEIDLGLTGVMNHVIE